MKNKKALAGLLVSGMLLSAVAVTAFAAPGETYTGSPTTVNLTYDDDSGLYNWTDPDSGETYTYTYDETTGTFTRNTQIEDEDTPLADGPDINDVIPNFTPFYTDTPEVAPVTRTIDEEEVPLAALPPTVQDTGEIGLAVLSSDDNVTTGIIAGDELVVSTDGTGRVRYEDVEDKKGEVSKVIVVDMTTEEGKDDEADVTISKSALQQWSEAEEPVSMDFDFARVTLQPKTSGAFFDLLGNIRFMMTKLEKALIPGLTMKGGLGNILFMPDRIEDGKDSDIPALLGEEEEEELYRIVIVNEDGDEFVLEKDKGEEEDEDAEGVAIVEDAEDDEEAPDNVYQVTVPDPEHEGEEITIHGIIIDFKELAAEDAED